MRPTANSAGADLVLRLGSDLRGFDFQRQPARLENRLPAQSNALETTDCVDYRLYRRRIRYLARVGTALRSLRLYRRNAARRHGRGAGFGGSPSDFDDDHRLGHFRPQPEWAYIFTGIAIGAVLIVVDLVLKNRPAANAHCPSSQSAWASTCRRPSICPS